MTSETDPNSAIAVVAPKKTSYRSLVQNPGGFRFMVGDVEITALSDGTVAVDYHHVLTNVTPEKIDSVLSDLVRPSTCEASVTAFLVKTGNRIILVDTGAGELFGNRRKSVLAQIRRKQESKRNKQESILARDYAKVTAV